MKTNLTTKRMILMTEGLTQNGLNITKEMILNSLITFMNKPVVLNYNEELKDYTNEEVVKEFNKKHIIGIIHTAEYNPNGYVEGNVVFSDENYAKDKFDNWQIELSDDKNSFVYCSCEIFSKGVN